METEVVKKQRAPIPMISIVTKYLFLNKDKTRNRPRHRPGCRRQP